MRVDNQTVQLSLQVSARAGAESAVLTEMAFSRLVSPFLTGILAVGLAAGASGASQRIYKGAIVMDAGSGRVIFSDRADEMSPPASMTKLMTFAVLEDRIHSGSLTLQTPVAVTRAAARVGMLRDSTSVWLKQGEVYPIEDLIYAMMIQSANDAAYAVAEKVAGSIPAFVDLMNEKARTLGMVQTRFRTPNGLPMPSHRIADGDLTTPREFAMLCRYLLLNTDVIKYTSVKNRSFGYGQRAVLVPMTNHNRLLGKVNGVDGLKTGFTNGAGFCLAATAERHGRRILVVMMDCPDQRSRDLRVADLIERGFASLSPFGAAFPPSRPEEPDLANPPVPELKPGINFSIPSTN
jgi:D-alanyl-D-alanine carboxypeptidase (penicillin-binding protein 5/6)